VKIRNGFVSNSSSSSFLLFLPKSDKTVNDMKGFEDFLIDDWGLEGEEDMKYHIEKYEEVIQSNFDKGNGFIEASTVYGGGGEMEDLAKRLGGEIVWMDNY